MRSEHPLALLEGKSSMRILALFAGLCLCAVFGLPRSQAAVAAPQGPDVKLLQSHPLPGVPGKSMTAVLVTFPPGFRDRPHHHVGSVFVYVLSGTMRTAFASAPPMVIHAGQSFFEPAGVHHRIAENASSTQPLRLLVTTVAPPDAPPATYDAMH
jgi:quercetin dioxygenase-like cupin family protein